MEGIKIFLIFETEWTAECFPAVVPHTHPNNFLLRFTNQKIVQSNTGGLNGWFPMSFLKKIKSTLSFWLFWMRTKTEVCPTSIGVDDSPSLNKIIHFFPDGEIRGRRDGVSLFLCHLTIYIKKKMAITTPLAYNPSLSPITGTNQVGTLAVGITEQDYSIDLGGVKWWMGADEEDGYVIAVPVSGNTQPTPISGVTASVGFYKTTGLTDNLFIQLTNSVFNQTFSSATDASIWLTNNGYWNSYVSPVLYLDAGNPLSYPGTGTVWTDLVGGKQFNLINGPGYDPTNGGKFYFFSPGNQYAQCNTSLTSLPTFTTVVWHYWDGVNTGSLPCILTEIYVGGPINYFLGALQGVVAQSGYFNGGFEISPQFTLNANTWYQIVTTCDSNQVVKVYINNTLISTISTSGAQPSSSNAGIRLMRRWDDNNYWGGYLSTVGIYDKALTQGQISGIYNATKSRYGL